MVPAKDTIETYFEEVSKLPIPTREQEIAWFRRYKKLPPGSAAHIALKKEITCGYLRFVIRQARNRTKEASLLSELIGEGHIGLMIAIDKFDLKHKVRFLTYAAWWIDVQMQSLLNSRLVHVPHQTLKDQRRQRLQEDREMAQGARTNYSFTEVTTTSIDKISLAHPAEEPTTDAETVMLFLRDAGLTRRQRLILMLYYGLRGGTQKTLEEISQLLFELEGRYLTRERVRQLKELAAERLHSYLQSQGIEGSWEI